MTRKGGNRRWCEAYKNSSQRLKNKRIRLVRHIKQSRGTDHAAIEKFRLISRDLNMSSDHLSKSLDTIIKSFEEHIATPKQETQTERKKKLKKSRPPKPKPKPQADKWDQLHSQAGRRPSNV